MNALRTRHNPKALALAAVLAACGLLVGLAAQAAPLASGSGAGTGRPSPAATNLAVALPQPHAGGVAAEPSPAAPAPGLPGQIRPSDASTGFFLVSTSAHWGSSGVEIFANAIQNTNSTTSGDLFLELWATTTAPVFGNTISFYQLGPAYSLGTLTGNHQFNNVDTGLQTPYAPPPNGCYFVTVALIEYDGTNYFYVDLATFNSGGVTDPGGSGFDLFGFGVSNASCNTNTHGCTPNSTTLCIDQNPGDGRFQIQVFYSTVQGGGLSGSGNAIALSSVGVTEGGLFWFFGATNPEMLIKIIDGCSLGGHFWVFYAATTNVGFTVTVTDTVTGHQAIYHNPDLTAALPEQDTSALTCP
jgi:hypothetical protein